MDEIFIYCVPLPPGIHEMITPCADGYTIYLNISDCKEQQGKAFEHALEHIRRRDFNRSDVQEIENNTHERKVV